MLQAPVPLPITIPTNQVVTPAEVEELSHANAGMAFKQVMLRGHIERIIAKNEKYDVQTGIMITDMQSSKTIVGHDLDTEQFAASINKIPVAALVLRDVRSGKLGFNTVLSWQPTDMRAGAGTFDQEGAPLKGTVRELLYDLLSPSGNTAVRVLVNQGLGGAATVNTRIKTELNLVHTYLQPLDDNRFYLGNSTPREALRAMQELLNKNDDYGVFVRNALATNIYTSYGVRSQLAGNDYIVLANKVGILDDADGNNRHDVGIIYNTRTHKSYGYAFMNTAPGDPYDVSAGQAGVSLADMGDSLLRFAGDKTAPSGRLKALDTSRPEQRIQY